MTPAAALVPSLAPGASAPSFVEDRPDTPSLAIGTPADTVPDARFASAQTATYDLPEPVPERTEANAAAMSGPSERYQSVANQMAEAVARQINAAIDNGHWRVEMHINPPNMGQIDVALSSAPDGTLDAQFSASQEHTRQMLTDALPHLKETLANAGIPAGQLDVHAGHRTASDGASYNAQPGFQQSFNQNTRQEARVQDSLPARMDEGLPEDSPSGLTTAVPAATGLLDVLA